MIGQSSSRRRGVVIVYVVCSMTVLLGLCSLAVDLGRVQVAKTELRRLADAAARVGAATLPQGSSAVQTAAIAIPNAGYDLVDGSSFSLTKSNVTLGYWTSAGGFSTSTSSGASPHGRNRASYVQCSAPFRIDHRQIDVHGNRHIRCRSHFRAGVDEPIYLGPQQSLARGPAVGCDGKRARSQLQQPQLQQRPSLEIRHRKSVRRRICRGHLCQLRHLHRADRLDQSHQHRLFHRRNLQLSRGGCAERRAGLDRRSLDPAQLVEHQ